MYEEEDQEMEHDGNDSDSDFEVIALNPNILYESDDATTDDESNPLEEIKIPEPNVVEKIVKIAEVITEISVAKVKEEEVSCDTSVNIANDDEMCVSTIDNIKKVRKKLKLAEYQQRRANQKPEPMKPLFDLPKRIANYELCDTPTSLPLLILPTDVNCLVMMSNNQIVKKEEPGSDSAIPGFNPELYEEIIIMSMSCNTEITIPPFEDNLNGKPASNFLVNIVNNLNLNNNVESLLNSSTSLFSSIQAVVQGKCTEIVEEPVSDKHKEHGEDKTIMHLRKDRLRPFKCTISTQTDSQPFFPPLILAPTPKFNRSRNARNFRRKASGSRSRSRSFSPDYERVKCNGRYSRSQHSTHSSSMTGSSSSSDGETSGSESDDSAYSASSDSLKRFNDRQNFRFYNRNQRDQGFKYPGKKFRINFCITFNINLNLQRNEELFTSVNWKN